MGINKSEQKKLQSIINASLRIVFLRRKFESTSDIASEFGFLPISEFITFRALSLVYCVLKTGQPRYLSCLLHPSKNSNLRSAAQKMLDTPLVRCKLGERTFARYGPVLWNAIPLSIRQSSSLKNFQWQLKEYLMKPL
jgi:hypothetical protein